MLTSDLGTLLSLEGCLSGNVAGGKVFTDKPAPASCASIAETKPAQAVLGGATFLNQSAIQASELLRSQTRAAVEQARTAGAAAAARARRQGLSPASSRRPPTPPGRRSSLSSSSRSSRSRSSTARPASRGSTTQPS